MTTQNLAGDVFDAIVFGEQTPRHWLAGSDFFRRTQDLDGIREDSAHQEPVHLALVYDNQGQISFYRNGDRYGSTYKTQLQQFPRDDTRILFGMRHGLSAAANRMLRGRILEARIYDRALSEEEIEAAALQFGQYQSAGQLTAMMSELERSELEMLQQRLHELSVQLDKQPEYGPAEPWVDLAHAMFNMKEFIYVR